EGVNEDEASVAAGEAKLHTEAGGAGETFTLTTGVDTFAGTDGNDTINAFDHTQAEVPATTLTLNDSIDGGAGTDTLNLVATEDHNRDLVGTVKNVEVINVKGSDYVGSTATEEQLAAIAEARTNVFNAWRGV